MSIVPLPQFEADVAELEAFRAKEAERNTPRTAVVRFGAMKFVGEYPLPKGLVPGCGSKLVAKTHRGTELVTLLTATCPNSGCGSSVSRKQMLEYIDASGGRDYPFFDRGEILRVATGEDLEAQERIDQSTHELRLGAKQEAERLKLPVEMSAAEPILGGQVITFYYQSEQTRPDLRDLARALSDRHGTHIDFKHVGARDEARLVADYERCGQYCCCKNFLKVLKPVSMRSAKVQKATLDPLKISGRCGRLMCCLRYEDQTYTELKKNLPKRKTAVGTSEGDGLVVDTQILTQLALVLLDGTDRRIAVPIEDLTEPTGTTAAELLAQAARADARSRPPASNDSRRSSSRDSRRSRDGGGSEGREGTETRDRPDRDDAGQPGKKKRRRRRRGKKPAGEGGNQSGNQTGNQANDQTGDSAGGQARGPSAGDQPSGEGASKKKRRRRRRRRSGGEGGGEGTGSGSGPAGDSGS